MLLNCRECGERIHLGWAVFLGLFLRTRCANCGESLMLQSLFIGTIGAIVMFLGLAAAVWVSRGFHF